MRPVGPGSGAAGSAGFDQHQQNPLHETWVDPAFAGIQLNEMNVLDYFCRQLNPFYDKSSLNEYRKMQRVAQEAMA